MTWQAAAIIVGGILALAAGVAWLIHRASRRAEEAETAAAVARAVSLDLQARQARLRAQERYTPMSDDELVAESERIFERIRKDRGGRSP